MNIQEHVELIYKGQTKLVPTNRQYYVDLTVSCVEKSMKATLEQIENLLLWSMLLNTTKEAVGIVGLIIQHREARCLILSTPIWDDWANKYQCEIFAMTRKEIVEIYIAIKEESKTDLLINGEEDFRNGII